MPNIKIVKTLVLSDAVSLKVVSGHPASGLQTEDIDVTDMSNLTRLEKQPRPQLEATDVTFLAEYAGTLATVGAPGVSLKIDVKKGDDANLDTKNIPGYVKSAIPVSVDVGGERRLLQEIIFTPDGSEGTTTTTVTTTTTTTTT